MQIPELCVSTTNNLTSDIISVENTASSCQTCWSRNREIPPYADSLACSMLLLAVSQSAGMLHVLLMHDVELEVNRSPT